MATSNDWREALSSPTPERLLSMAFDGVSLPDVAGLEGIPEPIAHHPEGTTGLHMRLVVEQAWRLTASPGARLAALMHDIGKADSPDTASHNGHDRLGAGWMRTTFSKCALPMEHLSLCERTAALHQRIHGLSEKTSPQAGLHLLEDLHGNLKDDAFAVDLAAACESDARGRLGLSERPYPQADLFLRLRRRALEAGLDLPIPLDDGGKVKSRLKSVVASALTGKEPELLPPPTIVPLSWVRIANAEEAEKMGGSLGRCLSLVFKIPVDGERPSVWMLPHAKEGEPPLAVVAVRYGKIVSVFSKNGEAEWKASISKAMSELSAKVALRKPKGADAKGAGVR